MYGRIGVGIQDLADSDAGLPEELPKGWRVKAGGAWVVGLQLSLEDSSICTDDSEGKGGICDGGPLV